MTQPRDRARLCENLRLIRDNAPADAAALLAAERAGQDIGTVLTAVLRRLGAPEPPGPLRRPPSVPAGEIPSAEVFVCPAGACDRTVPRRSGMPAPRCALHEDPLRLTWI